MQLFINHTIYLTPEERKLLGSGPAVIEVIGVSGIQEREVFVRYFITNECDSLKIEPMPDGYKLGFPSFQSCASLKNIKDGGSAWLHFNIVSQDIIHQIILRDIFSLEQSTVCDQLACFLKKK